MPKRSRQPNQTSRAVHLVAVDMGYGHERPARTLAHLAVPGEGVVIANDYPGILKKDAWLWKQSRQFYEVMSRTKSVPVIGETLFDLFIDRNQRIDAFYPRRDLSKPSGQLRQLYAGLRAGHGRHLIEQLAKNPVPLVTTFFYVAFMAEQYDYPGPIWCITTDTDISRAWAPMDSRRTRIRYIVGNGRCAERLKLYGVPEDHIFLTGFPLPKALIGGVDTSVLKEHLLRRLCVLDPDAVFRSQNSKTLDAQLGSGVCPIGPSHGVPEIMFAIGGAGAQEALAETIVHGMKSVISEGRVRLHLMAGARPELGVRLEKMVKQSGLGRFLGAGIRVSAYADRSTYFAAFDEALAKTDILWTKPSELSFYTGLGLPMIIAPPVGSQEVFNRKWLEQVGGGVFQEDPAFVGEWIRDWIAAGAFARMAWNGYSVAPTHGVYRIESLIFGEQPKLPSPTLIV